MIVYFYPTESYNQGRVNLTEERFQLGDISFKNFWVKDGWKIFNNIANGLPYLLEDFTIIDEQGKKYTSEEIVSKIETYKLIQEK